MSAKQIQTRRPRRVGFSLIELMVVMAILAVLLSVMMVVGGSALTSAKKREAKTMLGVLDMAAKQFADEKPLSGVRGYKPRYGHYPPDELDGFIKGVGLPDTERSLSKGHLSIKKDTLADARNCDIKAFALAARTYSESAGAILDKIAPKYRVGAKPDEDGKPLEYLDRSDNDTYDPGQDEPLDYFVDPWGTPIAYFAITYSQTSGLWDRDTANLQDAGDRVRTSAALRMCSNDVPVFVSYGPDGPDQFSEDFKIDGYHPDLIYDLNEPTPRPKFRIDMPGNSDNVYSIQAVEDRIQDVSLVEGDAILGG